MIAAGYFGGVYFGQYGPEVAEAPVPPVETGQGGGWVHEEDVRKMERMYTVRGKIRAVASPAVAYMDGTVKNPFRQRALPEVPSFKPFEIPEPVVIPPDPVFAEIACVCQAGTVQMTGSVGVSAEEFDAVVRRFQDAQKQVDEFRLFGLID